MAKKTFSHRAEILKRVLDWVNHGQYCDFGRFMVFGKVGVSWEGDKEDPEDVYLDLEDSVWKTEESKASAEIMEVCSQLEADVDRDNARLHAKQRTSLTIEQGPTTESFIGRWQTAWENLSPQAKTLLRKGRERALEENPEPIENADQEKVTARDDLSELLDWHYSEEVLAKLEEIVRRASLLDVVETAKIPSESVEKYFEEAHRCFLYGFPIATAVLCRAVLEAVLPETLDPTNKIRNEMKDSTQTRYYKKLTLEARKRRTLKGDCEYCKSEEQPYRVWNAKDHSPDCPVGIIQAGNEAIHDVKQFKEKYPGDKAEELLLNTRKVLIALLTKQKGEQCS